MRHMSLNLIDKREIVLTNIEKLTQQLDELLINKRIINSELLPTPITRAPASYFTERIEELKGITYSFKTSQLPCQYTSRQMISALEGLAVALEDIGIQLIQSGVITIADYGTIFYDETGIISRTEPELGLTGLNAIEVLAGVVGQDFGLIIKHHQTLIYFYSSARFEKTPKHVETGYDYFVGEDFLEWHRRIPTWGEILANMLDKLFQAFCQQKLDLLSIDLKGRHVYTNEKVRVCRYERDYAVPLRLSGETIGMIVFADSLFKPVDEKLSFTKGKHLQIDSPRQFHQQFKIIKHEQFAHHPFGMREKI